MSQENVEIVRAAYDAFNRGDLDVALKHAAPDCELDWSRGRGPNAGVYKLDQMRSFLGDFTDTFESVRVEPVGVPAGTLCRAVSLRGFPNPEEALEAAGLRE